MWRQSNSKLCILNLCILKKYVTHKKVPKWFTAAWDEIFTSYMQRDIFCLFVYWWNNCGAVNWDQTEGCIYGHTSPSKHPLREVHRELHVRIWALAFDLCLPAVAWEFPLVYLWHKFNICLAFEKTITDLIFRIVLVFSNQHPMIRRCALHRMGGKFITFSDYFRQRDVK